jgi:hypothetical protein
MVVFTFVLFLICVSPTLACPYCPCGTDPCTCPPSTCTGDGGATSGSSNNGLEEAQQANWLTGALSFINDGQGDNSPPTGGLGLQGYENPLQNYNPSEPIFTQGLTGITTPAGDDSGTQDYNSPPTLLAESNVPPPDNNLVSDATKDGYHPPTSSQPRKPGDIQFFNQGGDKGCHSGIVVRTYTDGSYDLGEMKPTGWDVTHLNPGEAPKPLGSTPYTEGNRLTKDSANAAAVEAANTAMEKQDKLNKAKPDHRNKWLVCHEATDRVRAMASTPTSSITPTSSGP